MKNIYFFIHWSMSYEHLAEINTVRTHIIQIDKAYMGYGASEKEYLGKGSYFVFFCCENKLNNDLTNLFSPLGDSFVASVTVSVLLYSVNTHIGSTITRNTTSRTTSKIIQMTIDTKMPTPIIFNFSLNGLPIDNNVLII